MSVLNHILAIINLLSTQPERSVPLKWLLRRPSLIDKRFRNRAHVTTTTDREFQNVTINGKIYVWPQYTPLESLLNIVSELQNANHPNQYLWGNTKIEKSDIVIDIGACEGSFSVLASEIGAKVVAVEPSRVMIRIIDRLFELRGLEKPRIVNCLLGAEEGEWHFVDKVTNPGASKVVEQPEVNSYPLPMMTLDALIGSLGIEKLDFIKCDAEGADVSILKSGSETLRRFHPKLAISTYHRDGDYHELYEFIKSFGYNIQGKGFLNAGGRYRVIMLHSW